MRSDITCMVSRSLGRRVTDLQDNAHFSRVYKNVKLLLLSRVVEWSKKWERVECLHGEGVAEIKRRVILQFHDTSVVFHK